MNKQEGNPPIAFPYATHLDILFPHLEKIDVLALTRDVKDQWYNQNSLSSERLGYSAWRDAGRVSLA